MKNTTSMMMAATLAIGTLAAGCQTTSITAPVTQPVTSNLLQANDWQLVDAKDTNGERINSLFIDESKPLTLKFMTVEGNNRVAFINTCNSMGAGYSVTDGEVNLTQGMSTMMACPEPQASFDAAALATVDGKYSINNNVNNTPILTIKNDSQVAHFKAVSK
ncbi:MAG: META domain-containing protein [Psychrobacter sp.]|uniref:META domain-containing protein n=1 Tax=unclassified Psychrobacter TaxID=196806 RepID=UPI001787BACD|nr:META domain-containing protein [Psychrobacter sp. FME13]MBE0440759.1 META domain-containing protein [Psychrobacter sp. FME13]